MNIIDKSEYEKFFPNVDTGNKLLDILLTQLKICNSCLDDIIFCYQGEYEEMSKELQDIFWLDQFNEINNPILDTKKKINAYEKILEQKSKIPLSIKSKFESRLPFSMHEGFTQSLASSFGLLKVIEVQININVEEAQNKEELECSLFENYSYLTHLAISVGGLKSVFMYQAERFFLKKTELSIHQKGAIARKEKYLKKKEEAFKIFKEGNFYSYAECAREIYELLGLKNPNTVANWLSEMNKQNK